MSLFSTYVPFKKEFEDYFRGCQKLFAEIGNQSMSRFLDGFISEFNSLRYNITIIGSLKRGKSTLLNTLMERVDDDISPISSDVCTSAIIKYLDKKLSPAANDRGHAIVCFDNEMPSATVELDNLRDYVTEMRNPANVKHVRSVDVYGDFPAWSQVATIVDSPGQNSVYHHHDTLLCEYLPYADAIIFLVAADIPLDGGDLALLKQLRNDQKRKIFFVLTKMDTIDNHEDYDVVVDFVKTKIVNCGMNCDHLYAVSAKPVYDALRRGASKEEVDCSKEQNGIAELERALERFIVHNSDSTLTLRKRIGTLLEKTREALEQYTSETRVLLSKQSFELQAMQAEEDELEESNKTMRTKLDSTLKEFHRECSSALAAFERKLELKQNVMCDRLVNNIRDCGLVDAAFKSFKLKELVGVVVQQETQPLIIDLQENLEKVSEKLNRTVKTKLHDYVQRFKGPDGKTLGMVALSGGTVVGTAVAGLTATHTALTSAMGACAEAAKLTASCTWIDRFFKTKAAVAAATATSAASTAIVTAVATGGIAIGATLVVRKIVHAGLVGFQENRIISLVEVAVSEIRKMLVEGMKGYTEGVISEYRQQVEDAISENIFRINEVKRLISEDHPDARKQLEERVRLADNMLNIGTGVREKLPLLETEGN